jgi:hypothetical protein
MFSNAVGCGNRLKLRKTKPMRRLRTSAMRSMEKPLTSSPRIVQELEEAVSRHPMVFAPPGPA